MGWLMVAAWPARADHASGVFTGSAAWWLFLSNAVGWLRTRLGPALLVWINRLSGLILVGFGLLAVWTALR